MSSPLVSVIMPCYNRADIIGSAVHCLQRQTFCDWELIVVDDGSKDDIAAAMGAFCGDSRIRLVRHPVNRGASAARNTGMAAASGRFIAFLDSDDEWLPEKLQRQVAATMRSKDPDNVFCVTQSWIILSDRRRIIRPLKGPMPGRSFAEFLYADGGFAQTSTFFLSTALARRFPFREHLRQMEDHLFFIEVGRSGAEYVLVPEPLSVWHNDDRLDRASQADVISQWQKRAVEAFAAEIKELVPPHVVLAAEIRYLSGVLWRTAPVASVKSLIHARLAGALTTKQVAALFCRNALPDETYNTLRHWLTLATQPRYVRR
jgi:glycosyltransferase involved in cell wall biosynthesis